MRTFASLLSEFVERAGIPDADLARRMGVSRQTVFRWREGTTRAPRRREDLLNLARLLRLDTPEREELLLSAGFAPEGPPASPLTHAAEHADDAVLNHGSGTHDAIVRRAARSPGPLPGLPRWFLRLTPRRRAALLLVAVLLVVVLPWGIWLTTNSAHREPGSLAEASRARRDPGPGQRVRQFRCNTGRLQRRWAPAGGTAGCLGFQPAWSTCGSSSGPSPWRTRPQPPSAESGPAPPPWYGESTTAGASWRVSHQPFRPSHPRERATLAPRRTLTTQYDRQFRPPRECPVDGSLRVGAGQLLDGATRTGRSSLPAGAGLTVRGSVGDGHRLLVHGRTRGDEGRARPRSHPGRLLRGSAPPIRHDHRPQQPGRHLPPTRCPWRSPAGGGRTSGKPSPRIHRSPPRPSTLLCPFFATRPTTPRRHCNCSGRQSPRTLRHRASTTPCAGP